jgi:hypothetical protein
MRRRRPSPALVFRSMCSRVSRVSRWRVRSAARRMPVGQCTPACIMTVAPAARAMMAMMTMTGWRSSDGGMYVLHFLFFIGSLPFSLVKPNIFDRSPSSPRRNDEPTQVRHSPRSITSISPRLVHFIVSVFFSSVLFAPQTLSSGSTFSTTTNPPPPSPCLDALYLAAQNSPAAQHRPYPHAHLVWPSPNRTLFCSPFSRHSSFVTPPRTFLDLPILHPARQADIL